MTGLERLTERLADARTGGAPALLPYLSSGYPDPQTFDALVRAVAEVGVPVIEIGFPYSDSIADGVVIQSSFHQVLANGWTVERTLRCVEGLRADVACALVAMVSYSIAFRRGAEAVLRAAADAGFDGVILPDVPVDEAQEMRAAADTAGLAYIGLVAPTTPQERRLDIARKSTGFVYQIAAAGTTGARATIGDALCRDVGALRDGGGLPVCVGFGISRPEHVRQVCAVADGAIVGSAIVRRIEEARERGTDVVDEVASFLQYLTGGPSA